MWSDHDGGGGFNTPGGTTPGGGGVEKKRQRAQNLIPVEVKEILDCHEETMKVEGQEVGMISVVGQIKTVNNEATKSVYGVEDDTGSIDVIQWVDDGQDSARDSLAEDMYCRVIGSVRTSQDKKHIMAFKLIPLDSPAEIEGHALEVRYAKLKIRQLRDKENAAIGANTGGSSLSNSMMMGSSSGGIGGLSGNTFSNPKHEATFKMIASCSREEGISREELLQTLSKKMSKNDLNDALYFLSGEGHIYSTIDEDHFKTTDS